MRTLHLVDDNDLVDDKALRRRFANVDDLLADARSRLNRVSADQSFIDSVLGDALLVDIRPGWQRRTEGEIPGSFIVDRNHLEWRLHPQSAARLPVAAEGTRWIVFCSEGYTSSLAADALNSIGVPATDIIGGFHAWVDAGLPWSSTETANESRVRPCGRAIPLQSQHSEEDK